MTTNTQAELREKFSKQHEKWLIGTCDDAEAAQEWVMENLPSLLALLPPAPAVGEAVEECKGLLRVMIERDPYETITDPDAGQWQMIDEWRHRARKALAALSEKPPAPAVGSDPIREIVPDIKHALEAAGYVIVTKEALAALGEGGAVGKEWKSGCASFLRTASRALGGEGDD